MKKFKARNPFRKEEELYPGRVVRVDQIEPVDPNFIEPGSPITPPDTPTIMIKNAIDADKMQEYLDSPVGKKAFLKVFNNKTKTQIVNPPTTVSIPPPFETTTTYDVGMIEKQETEGDRVEWEGDDLVLYRYTAFGREEVSRIKNGEKISLLSSSTTGSSKTKKVRKTLAKPKKFDNPKRHLEF